MVDDARLDVNVEKGAQGGPRFQTTILSGYSGKEVRNVDWAKRRGEWTIGYGIRRKADFDSIVQTFHAVRGRAYAFRFKDWGDFQASDQTLVAVPATTTDFQLVKVYSNGVRSYTRNITQPVTGTIVVKVGGVIDSSWTLQPGGIIRFGSAPGGTVTATFEFDVSVRFDTDVLPLAMQTADAGSFSSIKIVEVLE